MLKARVSCVDVLRGIAALWVVFYHLWNRYYPGFSTQGHAFRAPEGGGMGFYLNFGAFGYGYIGVTLFFVLSGFCIHLPQAKRFAQSRDDKLSLSDFARRRFWRLYPAYLASLIFTALVVGLLPSILALSKGRLPSGEMFQWKYGLANAFFLQHFFPGSLGFNGVYWTLLFEVQFYLFYPLLLVIARRWGFVKLLIALLVIELMCLYWPPRVPLLFFSRYYEWYLGMFAAEALVAHRRLPGIRSIAILGLLGGIGATLAPELWKLRDVILATGFFGLLVLAVRAESAGPRKRVLESKRLIGLGLISYSLYLVHVPVIDLVWTVGDLLAKYGYARLAWVRALAMLSVPLSLVIGYLCYKWFEEPFMSVKARKSSDKREIPGVVVEVAGDVQSNVAVRA